MNRRSNPGGSSKRTKVRPANLLYTSEGQALLQRRDLTNQEVADKIGCSEQTVRNHRRRHREPSAHDPTGDTPQPPIIVRAAFAQRRIYQVPDVVVVDELIKQFGVNAQTARNDIADARELLISDSIAERPAIRALATAQLKQIAMEARAAGDYGPAVSAWREIGRLHGAYEPDKITVVPSEALELGAIIGVLSPAGKAALDVLLEDIERARSAGQLPAAGGTSGAIDAEIVEPSPGN